MRSRRAKLTALVAPLLVAVSLAAPGTASAASGLLCPSQYTLYPTTTAWWLVYYDYNRDGLVCVKTKNGNVSIQDDAYAIL